jgi:uncharacterized membrane protein YgdD (TMEM256/DUF423 family)
MTRLLDARWAAVGALLAGLAVLAGAFGAHALRARLDAELLAAWETGARYQMYHGLALLGSSSRLIADRRWQRAARGLFLAGVVLFSGSLYLMALTERRWLGAVTPVGGLAFLAGWGFLAAAFLAREHPRTSA